MDSNNRETVTNAIQRFVIAVSRFFTCRCWVGSAGEPEPSLAEEETNRSSVRPWCVEEETPWHPNDVISP
ncbi:hypothetical protein SRHO_G00199300 [Serrasalmus rhombeus]